MKANLPLQILALLISLPLASCENQSEPDSSSSNHAADSPEELADLPTRLDMGRKIDIVASLHSYSDTYQLLHESHRISALKILEPPGYSDKSLLIRHSVSPDPDSDWRKAGAIFRIRIAEGLLDWIVDGIGFIGTRDVEIIEELTIIPIGFDSEPAAGTHDSTSACWRDLVGKFEEHGLDGLTDTERVYFLVRIADSTASSGGFHEVWTSPLGEYSPRFAYAFAVIGAATKASIFEEFDEMIVSAGQPKGILQRETAHSQLVASELEAIDTLDTRYARDQAAVDQLLQQWTKTSALCSLTD